ncbi:hypothetical protein QT327_16720 [Olivibacter sp. 47]|jgi:hypothetical protein|uniref:hypothetical protein n=1 Tax=Olivibacter sp. 47 TaxID=3056486 RepID=UPI0025A3A6B5|nr:hypothetical protein [Olivibacter sp. 47]MDM8175971.1 hypothetical protein [Olivibacter sp. 47]
MPNKKENQSRRQTNQYDKILRENLEITLPVIIKEILGLDIVKSEELPDDVQHTKERKPDALKKVTDVAGNTFILHVEFQVKEERDMVFRMLEYYAMLARRYRLPIRQYVVFLGDAGPRMATEIDTVHMKFSYELVTVLKANYRLFLKSDNPEVKMLGILGNFGSGDSYLVVKEIIEGVKSHTTGDFAESRYFKQLRIFVQLRSSLEQQFEKAMETVSKFFKEEKDFLYRKGEAKGEAKGKHKKAIDIARELKKEGLALDFIAKTTKLQIEEIEKL